MKYRYATAAAILSGAISALPVQAQQASPAPPDTTAVSVGLGVAYMPRYAGSDEHVVAALPVLTVTTRGAVSSMAFRASVTVTGWVTRSLHRQRCPTIRDVPTPTKNSSRVRTSLKAWEISRLRCWSMPSSAQFDATGLAGGRDIATGEQPRTWPDHACAGQRDSAQHAKR